MNSSASTNDPGAFDGPAEQPAAPAAPLLVEQPSTAHIVARSITSWRRSLADRAGGSSLADITLLGEAVLDLTAAHPSGVAQLFAGRTTQLANLFREGVSLPTARRRARAVAAQGAEHTERFGIAPTFLAIGVASWSEDTPVDSSVDDVAALARIAGSAGEPGQSRLDAPAPRQAVTVQVPVLLRPVRMHVRGSSESDYDIALEATAELNPFLSRALRSRGALLDPAALALSAFDGGGFDPRAVTERIHALGTAVLPGFELTERLLVGSFVHPAQVLVDDLDELTALDHNDLIAALATLDFEDAHLLDRVKGSEVPASELTEDDAASHAARALIPQALPTPRDGDEDPADERGVGDLDHAQRHLLDAITTGQHIFVDAPAGADIPGTIAAVLADAGASGRNVLYVPGHRRAAEQVLARLDELGLKDLVVDIEPSPTWRSAVSQSLLSAMTLEAPLIDRMALGRMRADLIDTRRRLAGYMHSLHLVRAPWDASAYDVLQSLARLTAERPAPATRVRFDFETAATLCGDARLDVADDLIRAAELGAFSLRPTATVWYGAALTSDDAAREAMSRTERLAKELLPAMTTHIAQVRAASGVVEPRTLAEWGAQLTMLDALRETLDVFQPIIFERTAADLVAATADRGARPEAGPEMTAMQRRRLVKQAKDMLRPGVRVPDLHAALVNVQAQREAWTAVCPGGGWPRLPEGLTAMLDTFRQANGHLDALDAVLVSTPGGAGLATTPMTALHDRLNRLAADRSALLTLPERTRLVGSLRARGLGDLLDDLFHRRVTTSLVVPELELSWWASAFEHILSQDAALAVYDGAGLEELAARFRELDRQHVASLPGPVLVAAIGEITLAMRRQPQESETLFAELLEGRFVGLRDVMTRFPDLVRALRPVVVASPTQVPHVLPPSRTVDLVVFDSVQHLTTDVLISAMARGRQAIVVGDARCASGSAVRDLSRVLPTVALNARVSSRDQQFVDFLVRHGYDGVLRPTPLPQTHALIGFDVVDGTGMPDESGAVITSNSEVERVVELAIDHALLRPEESLGIIALTAVHAERIRETLLSEVRRSPALAQFFSPEAREPVVIADLSAVAGLTRDAVIMSVGFGRTPHGRVLHRFETVAQPTGHALLLDALGVSRARLHVVAAFTAADLDPERLRTTGTRLLADLLEFAERRAVEGPGAMALDSMEADLNPDRLVIDLAERLWRAGLLVETDFGMPGGDRIPLVVGHPELPERLLVAVLTDDDAYIGEPSVRVRDRQKAERLEALGWTVAQVWSAAAFLDPVAEAVRIRQLVLDLAAPLVPTPHLVIAPTALGAAQAPANGVLDGEGPGSDSPATTVTPVDAVVRGEGLEDTAPADSRPESALETDETVTAAASPGTPTTSESAPTPISAETIMQGGFAMVGGEQVDLMTAVADETVAAPIRPARPDVVPGLPISAYGDNQIDELAVWICSDAIERNADQLAGALRAELGVVRRSNRVDTAVHAAVRRVLG